MCNQKGFIEEAAIILMFTSIVVMLWAIMFVKVSPSEQVVSGIVYNNTNNNWLSGNTHFSVRASVDTYVSEENQSSYCLPYGSPYIKLVNEAAKDKSIRVVVTTQKALEVKSAPWTCIDNVVVTREK